MVTFVLSPLLRAAGSTPSAPVCIGKLGSAFLCQRIRELRGSRPPPVMRQPEETLLKVLDALLLRIRHMPKPGRNVDGKMYQSHCLLSFSRCFFDFDFFWTITQ